MNQAKQLFLFLCVLFSNQLLKAQTPAGNYGNIQLNRNGLFDTPGSDSARFISGGLSIKGTGAFTGTVQSHQFFNGSGSVNMNDANAWTNVVYGNSSVTVQSGNIGFNTLYNSRLNLSNSAAVFNSPSDDYDVQIKGDTDANLFYADGSTDRIGIGTASPSAKLHVNGASKFEDAITSDGLLTINKTAGNYTGASITLNNGVNGVYGTIDMSNAGLELTTTSDHPLSFNANSSHLGVWFSNGNLRLSTTNPLYGDNGHTLQVDGSAWVGTTMRIATTSFPSTGNYKLAVGGGIIAEKVRVKLISSGWPDYVFQQWYDLPSLKHTEQFIKTNRHLPGVPSAAEIERDGLDLGDGQAVLLKKIEELTLHLIEMDKRLEKLEAENQALKKKLRQD